MSERAAKLLQGATGPWEVVIGMEVHAQVISRSKLFSGASTEFGGAPNSHVSLVDAAMPGMLPVINEECVRQAVRTGLGLEAQINLRSIFDRKNYFYPDLPKGYQISQFKHPIVGEGTVIVDVSPSERITVGIERLHLEQDAGKSLHDLSATESHVDLNRSGVRIEGRVGFVSLKAKGFSDFTKIDLRGDRDVLHRADDLVNPLLLDAEGAQLLGDVDGIKVEAERRLSRRPRSGTGPHSGR